MPNLIPQKRIETKILLMRGENVILDRDLAELYGVETKYLNRQVKRNITRFPSNFMFQLNITEKRGLVTKCHRFDSLKHSTVLPYAFTEYGALMLANVIKSPTAIEMSIVIVKAFVKLREIAMTHKDLKIKIEAMEKKYDRQFKIVFDAIRQLLEPPTKPATRVIGFKAREDKD